MAKKLTTAYRAMLEEHFSPKMEISFVDETGRQTLVYEKVTWEADGEIKGLRYGENPGQPAALYKLVNGNLTLGEVSSIQPGKSLISDVELLQSNKHPGKLNLTDVDSALGILRYFPQTPCTVIIKHNNPCGVAKASTLSQSYERANLADLTAAFGGAIGFNQELDRETAEMLVTWHHDVVAAPEFAPGVLDILAQKKNLRVMRIANMARLQEYVAEPVLDFKALVDGGLVVQWSYTPNVRRAEDFIPAEVERNGKTYRIDRQPTAQEYDDLIFGWLVEAGVSSNSVLYVKDGTTVGIGTGEQDRVGVAQIARDKAYRKTADRLSWKEYGIAYGGLTDEEKKREIDQRVKDIRGGLIGCAMISDGFFPFRDGVDVGIEAGISAIAQPGGSLRDFEVIEACNEAGVTMVYTGQRSFKH